MAKELRIPHRELRNPQNCSSRVEEEFRRAGLNVHRHEIDSMEDDHDADVRVIQVRTPKVMVGFGKAGS